MKPKKGIEKIRKDGFDALNKTLGPDGMIRFIQQFNSGSGDYSKNRHFIIDNLSIDAIVKEIKKK